MPGGDPNLDAPQFCCPGCRAVYALLHQSGLDDFYAVRAQLGEDGPARAPETPGEDAYAHYDDPAFTARFVRPVSIEGDERCAVELAVDGVHCTACVWLMERLPRAVPGVTDARLDFGRRRLHLRWAPEAVSLSTIGAALHRLGYPTRPRGASADAARRRAERSDLIRLGAMLAIAGNVMLLSFALYAGEASGIEARFARFFEWLSLALTVPAVTWGALPFYRGALAGLRLRTAHIDLPISLGVLASFGASVVALLRGEGAMYFDTVTALVALLLVGRYVQARGQRAAMNRAELLSALTPPVVRRRDSGGWARVPLAALADGDRLRVETGETLPADGVVSGTHGHVDQRLLTGEARPVAVGPGDRVYAGTVCAAGPLEYTAAGVGAQSRLGALVDLLDRADAERAPIARLADRLSAIFVAAVITLAALGGLAWAVIDPSRAFDVVVALLVVSCPCALGMATPIALAVARRRAADAGVIVRSTEAIERLARVERVCLDKTGTLTEGRMTVTTAELPARWRPMVAAVERRARHPIGRAIVAWAEGLDAPDAIDAMCDAIEAIEEIPGRGIEARIAGHDIALGAPVDGTEAFADALARGETPVEVRVDGAVVGRLTLADAPRADAAAALDRLRALDLDLTVLSGDHPGPVAALTETLGLTGRGGLSPEDKAAAVAGAAMVGDGFNDAPALRAADVGLAVHGGAEVALEVADVYLTRPGVDAIADAFEGSRRALATVKRGLALSLVYNATFATLALMGWVTPLVAAILMPISSLTVLGHAVVSPSFRR